MGPLTVSRVSASTRSTGAARGPLSSVQACRDGGIGRAHFHQPLEDQISELALELPTLGPRAIADRLALAACGAVASRRPGCDARGSPGAAVPPEWGCRSCSR
ncbi:MAG: hypothetical protein ACRDF0_10920 [Candidatus Limnocylindria bacterium]